MKLACGVLLVVAAAARAEDADAFSDLGFDAACAKAKDGNRIVLVDFFTTWCGPCKKLDKVTWADAKVAAWLGEKTVALKIDAEKEEALASKYHVTAYPTVLLLKPDGSEIDRLVGYREPEQFLHDAGEALAGHDSIARAKAKLEGDGAKDPTCRQEYGDALAERGRSEEALAEYLWCFDHGAESNAGYSAVRSTFLVSRIVDLGHDYPPALEALRKRRDACAERVLGDGGPPDATELARLNGGLGEAGRTVDTWDALVKKGGPSAARDALFQEVFLDLVNARRYQELAGSAAAGVDRLFEDWTAAASAAEKEKTKDAAEDAKYELETLVERGTAWYEVNLGAGRKDDASALAERILKASPKGSTWAALIRHATHAGDNALARSLVERGLKESKGKKSIQEAAKEIPEK